MYLRRLRVLTCPRCSFLLTDCRFSDTLFIRYICRYYLARSSVHPRCTTDKTLAQFWCSVSPFRINTCVSVQVLIPNELTGRLNYLESTLTKNRGGGIPARGASMRACPTA